MTDEPDLETCSRCLREFPWLDLRHVPATGENICRACINPGERTEKVN